ncbi:hypothetical protein SynMITS9220_00039 [Synechococcus sp. MIT S9220]|nr:hypothetical protein SynMITS9220_00039 [Synechococcus sp. MIT S9220]
MLGAQEAIQLHLLKCRYGIINVLLQPWADPFRTGEGHLPL